MGVATCCLSVSMSVMVTLYSISGERCVHSWVQFTRGPDHRGRYLPFVCLSVMVTLYSISGERCVHNWGQFTRCPVHRGRYLLFVCL